jgi:predicted esterase
LGLHYKIRTEKTGHYYVHGKMTDQTRYVWVCLHGYGQLAKYFINRFEFLDPVTHHVIVPEGLNRFYLEGVNEKPVATWMTREDRLDEIADYIIFLENLRHKMGWDRNPDFRVIYFAFSQGVATLIRWLMNSHPRVDELILWSGHPPDEMLLEQHRDYFSAISSHYFIGRNDQYLSEERLYQIQALLERAGIEAEYHWYDGEHKVDPEVLKHWTIGQKLI